MEFSYKYAQRSLLVEAVPMTVKLMEQGSPGDPLVLHNLTASAHLTVSVENYDFDTDPEIDVILVRGLEKKHSPSGEQRQIFLT